MKNDFDNQLLSKMIAESMQDFSDEEIQRVFGPCVASTKCINRIKELRDNAKIDAEFAKFQTAPSFGTRKTNQIFKWEITQALFD